jgi:hypothetical protein
LAASIANAVSGNPIEPWLLPLAWIAVPSTLYLLADRWASSTSGRRLLIQEAYEEGQRRRSAEPWPVLDPLTDELRESLDEAGRASFDLLEDAIERRDLADAAAA